MSAIFNELLHRPLVNGLAALYETIAFNDLGVAIILLTTIIRIVLIPLSFKTAKHQKITQALQPHLKRIQEEHKDDKTSQTKAMMALYKEHGINPMTQLFLVLIQLPILIALYLVFRDGLSKEALDSLYSFIPHPERINNTFFGLDLIGKNVFIVILAAIAQYFQGKLSLVKTSNGSEPNQMEKMGQMMVYIGPIMTLVLLWNFPAAVGLYWLTTTVFSVGQQLVFNKHLALYHNKRESQIRT